MLKGKLKKSIVITFLCSCVCVLIVKYVFFQPDELNKKDVENLVKKIYQTNEITQVALITEENSYKVQFTKNTNEYVVSLQKDTGEIKQLKPLVLTEANKEVDLLTRKESIKKVEKETKGLVTDSKEIDSNYFEMTVKNEEKQLQSYRISRQTGEISLLSQENNVEKQAELTKEEAKQIATNEVNGEVLEVDFEEDDEGDYYEVDILTVDNHEVTVEIDAYTSDILSISWDD